MKSSGKKENSTRRSKERTAEDSAGLSMLQRDIARIEEELRILKGKVDDRVVLLRATHNINYCYTQDEECIGFLEDIATKEAELISAEADYIQLRDS